MRELFRFLLRYNAFFLFVLLEVLAGLLIVQNKAFHRSRFLNSANVVTGSVYENYTGFTSYMNLKQVNDSLLSENARLREQLSNAYTDEGIRKYVIYDSLSPDFRQVFEYIEAKIISNTTNSSTNYFFIDKGKIHGVEKEMGVITNNGVAGIITDVSSHYAVAMSLLHQNTSISARLDLQGANGQLIWDGQDIGKAKLVDIPKSTRINIGDPIVTNGYSYIFPEDIPIGTVEDFKQIAGTNFVEVDVKLHTDFNSMSYVYVVDFLRKIEIFELEEGLEDDE